MFAEGIRVNYKLGGLLKLSEVVFGEECRTQHFLFVKKMASLGIGDLKPVAKPEYSKCTYSL